jgi:hypothetical protein
MFMDVAQAAGLRSYRLEGKMIARGRRVTDVREGLILARDKSESIS